MHPAKVLKTTNALLHNGSAGISLPLLGNYALLYATTMKVVARLTKGYIVTSPRQCRERFALPSAMWFGCVIVLCFTETNAVLVSCMRDSKESVHFSFHFPECLTPPPPQVGPVLHYLRDRPTFLPMDADMPRRVAGLRKHLFAALLHNVTRLPLSSNAGCSTAGIQVRYLTQLNDT